MRKFTSQIDERHRITKKAKLDGNPIGVTNDNPYLEARHFKIELSNSTMEECDAYTIAESMYLQVDDNSKSYNLLVEIVDQRCDGKDVKRGD